MQSLQYFRQQVQYVLRRTASSHILRSMSSNTGHDSDLTPGEKLLSDKLRQAFPDATHVQVADVSGGCGAMYQISLESPQFEGKRTIQQHRMVNEALAEEIKKMHGLQLNTKAPDVEQ